MWKPETHRLFIERMLQRVVWVWQGLQVKTELMEPSLKSIARVTCFLLSFICPYPLKSCSSMLSPKTLRNSLKAGVSSLFPNNSSSDVWQEMTFTKRGKKSQSRHKFRSANKKKTAHLSKLLIDNPKLERVVHLVFIVSNYQARSLHVNKDTVAWFWLLFNL